MRSTRLLLFLIFLCSLGFFLAASPLALANNATPDLVELRQPDGAKIKLHVRGDEYAHWFEDERGFTVLWDGKQYVYANRDARGELVPTGMTVGKADPQAAGLPKGLAPTAEAIHRARVNALPPSQRSSSSAGAGEGVSLPNGIAPVGLVKNLVILCKFSDHTFAAHTRPQAEYEVICNKVGGDPTLAPTGSVHDYYKEASYGIVNLQSTVLAWITLPHTEAYYANGQTGFGTYPQNGQGMVEDALNIVDTMINFGDFDLNNDGFVDAIDFIHSGYAADAGGGNGNWIWSHKWALYGLPGGKWTSKSKNANGENVKVFDYHTEAALWGTSGTEITRIGVICHETGHFFGLPDLYDTDSSSNGIGSYCLMANSWGFDGTQRHPPHFSAWCKLQLNFVTPTVITSGTFSPPQVETNKTIYRINNGFPSGEYLLVENREPVGFENDMPQGGLAVWHIDENKPDNKDEGFPGQAGWPGNNNHYKIALLQADGLFDLEHRNNRGDGGDLYRAGGQTSVTHSTSPNTDSYKGGTITPSNNSIADISSPGATMSFSLNAGAPNCDYMTLSASPPQGGTYTGEGCWTPGQTVTVTASPSTGYSFVNWTENGNPVSTAASYSFVANHDRTLVANFATNAGNRVITTSSSPSTGGTTSGGGSYANGATATVTATANTGFVFNNWTENGAVVSTSASYQFTVASNRALVANFVSDAGALPNLTPYRPNNWSDKIVISNVTGTNTDSASLSTTDTLYLDWAVINDGNTSVTANFTTELYVDNVFKTSWSAAPPTAANNYRFIQDYNLGSLSQGNHTIRIKTDSTNAVGENDESDNEYTRTITIGYAGEPNLTPYHPDGWSDKIVVSNVTGTPTDSPSLAPTDNLYLDWAAINDGTTNIAASFKVELYVDGVLRTFWTTPPPTNVNFYRYIQDYNLGPLSAGTHFLRIKVDAENAVAESDETDNEYTKTIVVGNAGSLPNLTPYQPSGWSNKIVVTNAAGTNTDSNSLSPGDTLYIDWAVINNGDANVNTEFRVELYVDGVFQEYWTAPPPTKANFYTYVQDYNLGSLSAGTHTLLIKADSINSVAESNEGDNEFTRTIIVGSAGQPNLTPFKPSGWADKIVISKGIGTNSDSTSLLPTDSIYMDWAVINNGTVNITSDFTVELYVDGVFKAYWTDSPPTNTNSYRFVQDYNLGSFSPGTHTVRIKADGTNVIAESNEADNEFTKTFTVGFNDNFAQRTVVSGKSGTIRGTNVGATKQAGEPAHAGDAGGASIWYSWTAPSSGRVTIDTFDSDFDTLLGVYTGTAVNGLTPVANNDDAPFSKNSLQSTVTFNAVAGVTYQIAVDGYGAASGNTVLHWLLTEQTSPPKVKSLSFSKTTGFTVVWTANAGSTYQVQRSTTPGFASYTVVKADIQGVAPTTSYTDNSPAALSATQMFYRVVLQ